MFHFKKRKKAPPLPQTERKGIFSRLFRFGLVSGFDIANLALALVVIAQSVFIYMIGSGMEIPVPTPFVKNLSQRLHASGMEARCESLHFDLDGGIRIEGLVISDLQHRDFFSASQLYVHAPAFRLFAGELDFDTLLIDDASILLPAYLSDEGRETPVAEHVCAKLGLSGAHVRIEHIQGMFGGLPLELENELVVSTLRKKSKTSESESEKPITAKIGRPLVYLARAERELNASDSTAVTIFAAPDGVFKVRVMSKSVEIENVKFTRPFVSFSIDSKLRIHDLIAYSGAIERHDARLDETQMELPGVYDVPTSLDALTKLTAEARIHISKASFKGESAHGIYAKLSRENGTTSADTHFIFDRQPISLEISAPDKGAATVRFEMPTEIPTWLRLAKIPAEPINKRFTAATPFYVKGEANIPQDLKNIEAKFDLWGWNMDARGMAVTSAYVHGTFSKNVLFCDNLRLYSGESTASGTFTQNVSTLDWRMDLRGSVYPLELGPVLGRWWAPIFEDFTFDGPRVSADLTINGNWKARHYVNLLGNVDLQQIGYNGVPIASGSLILYLGQGFVDVFDIKASSGNGYFDGELAWLLRNNDAMDVVLNINSTLPPEELDKAFGAALSEQLPDWTFEEPPRLHILGNLIKVGPGKWNNRIYVDGHTKKGTWRGIAFDSIDASVWSENKNLFIGINKAVMLGGTMRGSMDLSHDADNAMRMKLDLALDETELTPTILALQSLSGKKPDASATDRIGLVQLHFTGDALTNDIAKTLNGGGDFLVHDAELGKIKVFGALSSLLKGIGLDYGTFSLNNFSSNVTAKDGMARFRNSVLSGPAIKIEASGFLNLADNSLDFDAKVFPLSGKDPSLMNILGTIISPLGYILELSLKGTLDDPAWRFKIDPRNIFNSGTPAKPKPDGAAKAAVSK